MARNVTAFLTALLTVLVFLAASAGSFASEEDPLVTDKAVDELLAMSRTETLEVRLAAVEVLAEIGGPRATAALGVILWENQREVRMNAAAKLGEIGTPEALDALARASRVERDREVHAAVEIAAVDGIPVEEQRLAGIRIGDIRWSED